MGLFHYVILIVLFYCAPASAHRCVYHHVFGNDTYVSCDTGCCYTYIYPCCEDLFVDTVPFKIIVITIVVSLAISCVILVIRYRMRQGDRQQNVVGQNHPNIPMTSVYGNTTSCRPVLASGYGYDNSYLVGQPITDTPGMETPASPPNYFAAAPPAYSTLPPAYKELEDKGNNQ